MFSSHSSNTVQDCTKICSIERNRWRSTRCNLIPNMLENFQLNTRRSVVTVAALHHSWTSATSGLRGLFLITCRQNFFVCEAPSGARPSAVADVADA
ncbi:hypothetical protein EVAR_64274_1 [Eumeta japonica]|uniref:Uncharacterized protein n=1 Tax=Eumeta variegata TaxID=151549 RepID=A0A4C2A5H2_EUMVA|nr:hypothetical protein EVAR_64274_1 [Eumeta japonica]